MSLCINMPKITRVLLADGWHDCDGGISLDAYEIGYYVWDRGWGLNGAPRFHTEHAGGRDEICSMGFSFIDAATGETIAGPLTAILALAGKGIIADPEDGDRDIVGRPPPVG
jgi:hypothetical protein